MPAQCGGGASARGIVRAQRVGAEEAPLRLGRLRGGQALVDERSGQRARINGYERRPCGHCIASPDAKLTIVHYRVLDSQTNRRIANSLCYSLSVVFAAVHANDD